MRVEAFLTLLRQRHPSGSAWLVGQRLSVAFADDGKVYEYSGTVHAVAQRLDLIPSFDIPTEAARIASELASDGVSYGPPGASDTVRSLMSATVVCTDVCPDEYGRFVGTYSVQENDPWTTQ